MKKSDLTGYLDRIHPDEIWDGDVIPDLLTSFKTCVPQYFLLVVKEEEYLVNTEGYNYCRYMAKVETHDGSNH